MQIDVENRPWWLSQSHSWTPIVGLPPRKFISVGSWKGNLIKVQDVLYTQCVTFAVLYPSVGKLIKSSQLK